MLRERSKVISVLTSKLVDFLQSNLQLWNRLLHVSRQDGQKEPEQLIQFKFYNQLMQ